MQPILLLFGPTASGKSALANAIADEIPSVLINADAMQLYKELRILTARPSEVEEKKHPHALYGFLPAAQSCSAGIWLGHAKIEIEKAWAAQRLPVLVGGTGLYIKALMEGLSPIPDISPEIREKIRALISSPWKGEDKGGGHAAAKRDPHPDLPPSRGKELYPLLQSRDPTMAAKLRPSDTQRIARALEVLEETGQSLHHWQALPKQPLFPHARFSAFHIDIPREVLYPRCDARLEAMMKQGALQEIEHLAALHLSSDLPAMRAVGVPELMRYLNDECTLEEAITQACQATRNYAKRQLTWGRNQFKDSIPLPHTLLENAPQWAETLQKLRKSIDRGAA